MDKNKTITITALNPFDEQTINNMTSIYVKFQTTEGKTKRYRLSVNANEELEIVETHGNILSIIPKCSNVIALK